MYYQFGKLNTDRTQVVQIVNRGDIHNGIRTDVYADDSHYIDLGLIPIDGDTPIYNKEKQTVSMTYDITPTLITRVFTIEDLPIETKIKNIDKAIQSHLDSKAKEKGYDSILSACTYASYANQFQVEGQKFVEWRGNVWAYCYSVLAEVQNGTRAEPTIDELIAELPALAL